MIWDDKTKNEKANEFSFLNKCLVQSVCTSFDELKNEFSSIQARKTGEIVDRSSGVGAATIESNVEMTWLALTVRICMRTP